MKKSPKRNRYVVSYESQHGIHRTFGESETFDTRQEAEDWVSENLPIGVQKCRTGTYEILKVDEYGDEIDEG